MLYKYLILLACLFFTSASNTKAQSNLTEEELLFRILDSTLIADAAPDGASRAEAFASALTDAETIRRLYPDSETSKSLAHGGLEIGELRISENQLKSMFVSEATPICANNNSASFCELLALKTSDHANQAVGSTCTAKGDIVRLASFIIDTRAGLPGFAPGRYGTDAAYLMYHYGELDIPKLEALVERLKKESRRPAQGAEGLLTTGIVTLGNSDEYRSHIDDIRRPESIGVSELRAMLLRDDGAPFRYFFETRILAENKSEIFGQSTGQGLLLARAVDDQSDDTKLRLAEMLDSMGLKTAAAFLLAGRKNLSDYEKYYVRIGHEKLKNADPKTVWRVGLTSRHHAFDEIVERSGWDIFPGEYDIIRADYFARQASFLLAVYGQVGLEKLDEFSSVARRYLELELSGSLQPTYDPEIAWLYVYQEFVREMGLERARGELGRISSMLPSFAGHIRGGLQIDVLEWIAAKHSFRGYLQDTTQPLPKRSDLVGNLDWAQWTQLASEYRSTGKINSDNLDETAAKIAIELFLLTENYSDAIEMITQKMPKLNKKGSPETAVRLARVLMKRLDRMCEGHTVIPGEWTFFGRRVVYRF
ncbi:hypothetical protein KBY31_10440 [Ruegeria pomeroyi]|nr:hypothetical protein [Ruegeria pomeroyi]